MECAKCARLYEAISASLNCIADCLECQLDGTRYEHPHQERLTDMRVQRDLHKCPAASLGVDGTMLSLQLLAELVGQLESDVLKEPVFAS